MSRDVGITAGHVSELHVLMSKKQIELRDG